MLRNTLLVLFVAFLLSSCTPTGSTVPEVASPEASVQPVIGPGTVTSADGVEIAYTTHRIGDPSLVLVHGWMCDQSYWEEQVPVLAEAALGVVTVDLAGHGESGSDRQEWTTASLGIDVKAVIEQLRLERVIVVGHSMGGRVALEAARLLPGRVIGIIGVDTLHNADARQDPDQTEAMLAGFTNDFTASCNGFVRSMFGTTTDTVMIDKIVADMCAGPGPIGTALLRDYVAFDTAAAMEAAGVPVRCVNADKWPTDAAANQKYCDFEVTIISGAGHFLMQEAPAQLSTALIETVHGIINQIQPGTE
jgi:pimeloyl-ACP methyl ester carboxylesterase